MQFVKVCLEQLLLPHRRVPVSACMVVPSPRTLTWEKLGSELSLQRLTRSTHGPRGRVLCKPGCDGPPTRPLRSKVENGTSFKSRQLQLPGALPRPPSWVLLHAPWSCWVAGQRPQSGVSWFLPDLGVEVIWENCGFQTGLCFSSALPGRKLCSLMVSPFHPGVLTHRKCPPRPFLMWPPTPLPGLPSLWPLPPMQK